MNKVASATARPVVGVIIPLELTQIRLDVSERLGDELFLPALEQRFADTRCEPHC